MADTDTDGANPAGPYDHLSDEEKKAMTRGKCNFLALMLLSTIAFIQSGTATGYCDFAARDVKFVEGMDEQKACASMNMTGYDADVCNTMLSNHGVGFPAWFATVPVDTQVCLSYTQYVPGVGYVTPDMDSAFNAAYVFAVMATIFGAAAWFTLIFSSCCPIDNARLKGLSCWFSLAYICQAFTFLLFASDVCKPGFLYYYFPSAADQEWIEDVDCSLATGGSLSVSATCLYFICSILTPFSVAPLPVGYERMHQQEHTTAQYA